MRISANSTALFLSTAVRMATATPFFTQFSVQRQGRLAERPAGKSMVVGAGEDPATMSTSRCVRMRDLLRDLPDPLKRQRVRSR